MNLITKVGHFMKKLYNKSSVCISVIIPVYNASAYLSQCIQSVLNQTLSELEIICINDGSTDDSLMILKKFQATDPRIKIINQVNQGVARSRNRGIECAIGEYIAFLDADDYLPDEKVYEDLYDAAKENNILICGGSFMGCRQDGTFITSWKGSLEKFVFAEDKLWNFREYQFDLGFYRFIFNRRLLVQKMVVFPPLISFEDPVFLVKAMLNAGTFYALKRRTYCYRKGHHSYELNFRQVEDLLAGIIEIIKLAKTNNYKLLLDLQRERLRKTYIRRGMGRVLAEDKSGRLKAKFDEINALLNNGTRIEYEAFQYYIDLLSRKNKRLEAKISK